VGSGSTVTIYLPRSEGDAARRTDKRQEERSVGGTLLVVEDYPEVLSVCVSMLGQLGYETCAVSGAPAALEVLEHTDFDLVVSDIVMPGGMDGGGAGYRDPRAQARTSRLAAGTA